MGNCLNSNTTDYQQLHNLTIAEQTFVSQLNAQSIHPPNKTSNQQPLFTWGSHGIRDGVPPPFITQTAMSTKSKDPESHPLGTEHTSHQVCCPNIARQYAHAD
eukprot:5851683-Amphidinium_carterae.1